MVLASSHRISRVPRYSGYRMTAIRFRLRDYYPVSCNFPKIFTYRQTYHCRGPKPLANFFARFGLLQFRSPLLPQSLFYFLFLRLLSCFSSAGIICISPSLIAAYHVLHRRLVPRHPLYALCSLIIIK